MEPRAKNATFSASTLPSNITCSPSKTSPGWTFGGSQELLCTGTRQYTGYCAPSVVRVKYHQSSIREGTDRSEEHTSELQSRFDLVCRLLLEKKNTKRYM